MDKDTLLGALKEATDLLELGNRLETGGTPTDIMERAAILALEALTAALSRVER